MFDFGTGTTDYGGYHHPFWEHLDRERIVRYEPSECKHDCHYCPSCYTCADSYLIPR